MSFDWITVPEVSPPIATRPVLRTPLIRTETESAASPGRSGAAARVTAGRDAVAKHEATASRMVVLGRSESNRNFSDMVGCAIRCIILWIGFGTKTSWLAPQILIQAL